MERIIEVVFNFIRDSIFSLVAETTIIVLLLGLALIMAGVFIIGSKLLALIMGQKINGVVIGAVRSVKVKINNGEIIKKRLNSGVLFPVFEYTLDDGVSYKTKGSTGGSHVYKYKTGQTIKLTVWPRDDYHEVDDASSYFVYIFAASLIGAGVYVFYFYITNFASLNIAVFIWLGAIVSITIRYKDKIAKLIKGYKSNKGRLSEAEAIKRSFDPEHLHPIEHYLNER